MSAAIKENQNTGMFSFEIDVGTFVFCLGHFSLNNRSWNHEIFTTQQISSLLQYTIQTHSGSKGKHPKL